MWQGGTGNWRGLTAEGALPLATTYTQEKIAVHRTSTRQNMERQTAAQQLVV